MATIELTLCRIEYECIGEQELQFAMLAMLCNSGPQANEPPDDWLRQAKDLISPRECRPITVRGLRTKGLVLLDPAKIRYEPGGEA